MKTRAMTIGIGAAVVALLFTSCGTGTNVGKGTDLKLVAHHLEPFSTCSELLQWQIDHNLDQVGPYGWEWGGDQYYRDTAEMDVAPQAAGDPVEKGRAASATGTNTQEADVDEPDFAKTNGKLVISTKGTSIVATDVTDSEPRELGRYTFPNNTYISDLLLVGDRVIATADSPMSDLVDGGITTPYRGSGTTIHDLDFSNPAAPSLLSTKSYSGRRISARQYGDVVRIVLSQGLPALDFVYPDNGLSKNQATARNRQLVKDSKIEDWLPTVTTDGSAQPLLDCDDVRHPDDAKGGATLSVISYDVNSPAKTETTAITAAGENIYSSSGRLYVTSTNWSPQQWGVRQSFAPKVTTDIHEFTLNGVSTKYAASGRIRGTVKDQWSMDEYDGDLRVARSLMDKNGQTQDNGVVILRPDGKDLLPIGQINSLGINEEIQSVRWMDDLAVVVTFRQMDPLYTLDLADPTSPKLLGALKIPGFSAYLHPIGNEQLIGIGVDATNEGQRIGAQLATFDLTNLSSVKQTQVLRLGYNSDLAATYDPKAFTWLPDTRTAITTLSKPRGNQLLIVKVADNGTFTSTTRPLRYRDYEVRTLPLPQNRVAVASRDHVSLMVIP